MNAELHAGPHAVQELPATGPQRCSAFLLGRCARCQNRIEKNSLPQVFKVLGGVTPLRWGVGQRSAPHPAFGVKLSDDNSRRHLQFMAYSAQV